MFLVNVSFTLLVFFRKRTCNIEVADSCELHEGTEHEEETACKVDIDGFHVADFGHVVIATCYYGQQSQHCRDTWNSIQNEMALSERAS